jgi:hypothetical protein
MTKNNIQRRGEKTRLFSTKEKKKRFLTYNGMKNLQDGSSLREQQRSLDGSIDGLMSLIQQCQDHVAQHLSPALIQIKFRTPIKNNTLAVQPMKWPANKDARGQCFHSRGSVLL